jgi:hypothetical protein
MLITSALFALGAAEARADEKAAAPKEGKWLIAYAEEGGRRNNSWESQVATLDDGVLTFERDGKKNTLKLSFGPNQTVKADVTEGEGKGNYNGVYIAAQDYFCLSLNSEGGSRGSSSGSFILILKRQR